MEPRVIPEGSIVIQAKSHRARGRAGLPMYPAFWSWERAAKGYYAVPQAQAEEILARRIPGISRLRGPYGDLMPCHPEEVHRHGALVIDLWLRDDRLPESDRMLWSSDHDGA